MSFGAAVKTCFKKFGTFTGRARRAEFWLFYLFLQIVGLLGFMIAMVVGVTTGFFMSSQTEPSVAGLVPYFVVLGLWVLTMLVLTIPYLAVSARRLHDMGQTGHWLWLTLAGLSIVPVIMAFFDSEWGANRWGPDPKAGERAMYPPPQQYGQPAQPQFGQQPQYGQQSQYGQHQHAQPQYPDPQQYGQPTPQVDPFQQPPNPPQPPTQ